MVGQNSLADLRFQAFEIDQLEILHHFEFRVSFLIKVWTRKWLLTSMNFFNLSLVWVLIMCHLNIFLAPVFYCWTRERIYFTENYSISKLECITSHCIIFAFSHSVLFSPIYFLFAFRSKLTTMDRQSVA